MERLEQSLRCSCGGTVTVKVDAGQKTAAVECACGNVVFWGDNATDPAPSSLGIYVSDGIVSADKFGS